MPGDDPKPYLAVHSQGRTDSRAPLVFLHGLTYDRRQWQPVLDELAVLDPDRRIITLDLPGHGGSEPGSYRFETVCGVIHQAVTEAELESPVMVGHSLGGVLATGYAALHPVRGVVNLDQPLQLGGFGSFLQQVEPVLRGPGFIDIWNRLLANMHTELLPEAAQELLRTATTVRQDLLLGYWADIFADPEGLDERRREDLEVIGRRGVPYRYLAGGELDPEYRRWMLTVLPTAEVVVLPGSGHFPHLAQPRAVAEILSR